MAIFELIFDLCIEVILVMLFGMSYNFNVGQITKGDVLGASGFPRTIIVIVFLLMAYQIFILLKKILQTRNVDDAEKKNPDKISKYQYLKLVLCVLYLVVYIFGMSIIGYAISTLFFIFAFGKTVGYRKNIKLLVFTVVITVILVLLFGTLFKIALPRGKLFFKELSYYWY